MKVLAFTIALIVAGLPAALAKNLHDDPAQFSKDAKDDVDQLPYSGGNTVGDVLGFRSDNKKPGGLGSIRVTTGGKPEAWAIFAAATSQIMATGAKVTNNYVDIDATDQINNIICTLEFSSDKKNPIWKLHYQEHKATGLAWLQYELAGTPRRAHRIIFLARVCPYPYPNTAGSPDCANSPNTPEKTLNYQYPPGSAGPDNAVQYCTDKLKYTFTKGHKEYGDGGGGGEM